MSSLLKNHNPCAGYAVGRYTAMNKSAFEIANQEIINLGFQIVDSNYARESFGSWYITIEDEPNIRLVWEGKDFELRIEKETDQMFNGSTIWKKTWSKLKPSEAELKNAISNLKTLAV